MSEENYCLAEKPVELEEGQETAHKDKTAD